MKRVLGILMFLLMVGMVSAGRPVDVNPTCADLGYANELKIDPPVSGTYNGVTFTLANDSKHFDWSSTFGIDAVIAKGGPGANVYNYTNSFGDTGLVAPLNNGGQVPDLSHATFCWDDNTIPEFGVIAGAVALVGALGIFLFRRK
jgi:hypothetical protein